jgi:DNA-binding NtrC family response regulator
MADILVVDDDQSVATAFQHFLDHDGHACRLASNAEDAMRLISEQRPALVIMDVRMPGVDGLQALKQIRSAFPDVYVVIMTGYGTSQTSIDAIREGAFDYLTKPPDLDELRAVINKALEAQYRRAPGPAVASADGESAPRLVGQTAAMREVYKTIGRLAAIDVPALVVGEHGTGKELVIATIHENSARRNRRFLAVDCATIGEAALENDLSNPANGTVNLTQIEALSPALQARLARALGEASSRGVAGSQMTARIVASTEKDLAALVSSGSFNRELCVILSVVTVKLPPLRDRRDDIPVLVDHFIRRFNSEFDRQIARVDDRVMKMLLDHPWPGNVAELESVIKRGCILARSDVITIDEIGDKLSQRQFLSRSDAELALTQAARTALQERLVDARDASSSSTFHDIIDLVEMALIQEALAITGGNQVKAAGILGVNRATLRKKMPSDDD